MKVEPTENDKEQENPVAIPENEPDIPKRDDTPSILDQAKSAGFDAGYYNFGKLENQGSDFFNPGLVEREDGIWLLVRASGLHPEGFIYGQNRLVAFLLDETGKIPKMGKILHWPVENPQQHFEDPRGFYHHDLRQTIIGACTFMWNGPGDWTGALQVFGAFDDDWNCKKMDYPKIGANPGLMEKIKPPYEKNWIWWLKDDRLHLLYKANPWTVYQFNGRWGERTDYKIKGVTWNYGEIRGGTTPVLVGDMYFTFHHSSLPWKGRYRRYYAGAIAFDSHPPFKPRMITGEPLLMGSQNDPWAQRKPLVVFPCGALLRDGKWLVSCGVNDIKSAWFELTHEQLLERMQSVDHVSGQIFVGDLSGSVTNKRTETTTIREAVKEGVDRDNIMDASSLSAQNLSKDGGDATCPGNSQSKTTTPPQGSNAAPAFDPNGAASQTKQAGSGYDSTSKPISAERLEKLRANAAKARAAKAAKKLAATGAGGELQTGECSSPLATHGQPPKRRRKRYRRITAAARLKALQEYEAKKEVV